MSLVRWLIDALAFEDVIDAYFVLTDMVELNITDAEQHESVCYEALAKDIVNKAKKDTNDHWE